MKKTCSIDSLGRLFLPPYGFCFDDDPFLVTFFARWTLEQRGIGLSAPDLGQPVDGLAHARIIALAEHYRVQVR